MNWKILALGIPLAAALVACPPPPVTPSYTLAIDPATLTFNKPTLTAQVVNITVTPKDGFSSDLTAKLIPASGTTPTGITATDITIPANATTAQLSVVITSAATEGANQAFVVQTSGGGLDPQTQALSITVNKAGVTPPPPTPDFTLTTDKSTLTFTKPKTGDPAATQTVVATVARSGGFAGAVNVSLAPTATGITAAPITIASGATTGNLIVSVADTAAVVTSQAFNVSATATGVTGAKTKPLAITVSTAPAPVLDNILVTGTASLNLNTPVTFTAVGRDSSNNPLPTPPPFTWTSSNPNVTVDSAGKVTATKFITAPVTITATSGTKSGTFSVTSTYGMEASVGTYQIMDSSGGVSLGTAFLLRMRDAAGNIVSGNNATTFKIAGPATWNGGAVADAIGNGDFLWGALDAFAWLRTPPASTATSSAPVNGLYTITSPITAAVAYTGKAQLASNTSLLDTATFTTTEVTGTGASRTANIAWNAVAGATSYRVQILRNGTPLNGLPLNSGSGNHQTALTYSQAVDFVAGDTYAFRVIAYSANVTAADVTLPAQFNISSHDVNATVTGI